MIIKASELEVGMTAILPGRKLPVEIVMASPVYEKTGLRTLGTYGRGFSASTIAGDAEVMLVIEGS